MFIFSENIISSKSQIQSTFNIICGEHSDNFQTISDKEFDTSEPYI